ncbi:endonuclease III [uncultured Prevotella sp.]|uniref:endonuclease III n=1 Tax=uncultured Prevotella sp. TaxID=159272 RepID=UPI0026047FF2|nr:endonuclease III [uncultured Prevotella sp.]
MNKKDRYQYIIDYFKKEMPKVTTELKFGSVFQLLVAVILSAQCTDKRVNSITPQLFERYPDAKSMAEAETDEIYEYIKSVSYPNAKALHLVSMSRMLMSDFNGEVPDTMDKLIKLPGVGRKTANVIQAVAFGRSVIAVDTHVFRVSHRLGLVTRGANTPLKVESELTANIPAEYATDAHHWLLLHGRYVCTSRKPHCEKCPFDNFCPKIMDGSKL